MESRGSCGEKSGDAMILQIISQFKTTARILPHTGGSAPKELVMTVTDARISGNVGARVAGGIDVSFVCDGRG